jgi:hypothetical protein
MDDYARLGGHLADVRPLAEVIAAQRAHSLNWSVAPDAWPLLQKPMLG